MNTKSDERSTHDLDAEVDDLAERLRALAVRFTVRARVSGSDALELLSRAAALHRAAFVLERRSPAEVSDVR